MIEDVRPMSLGTSLALAETTDLKIKDVRQGATSLLSIQDLRPVIEVARGVISNGSKCPKNGPEFGIGGWTDVD